jgi:hypothetical protein
MIIIIIVNISIFIIFPGEPLPLCGLNPSLSEPERGVCGPPIWTERLVPLWIIDSPAFSGDLSHLMMAASLISGSGHRARGAS